MVEFSTLKIDWLRKYVDLAAVPCAETLRYFIACIKPEELIKGFLAFVGETTSEGDCISIDGKTLRGSRDSEGNALHVLNAWSRSRGISLGTLESEGKSNETKTVPKLLDQLEIKGVTVTADAMSCQKEIAKKVIERRGNYALQLKANQGNLLKEVEAYHHMLVRTSFENVLFEEFREVDKGHGRIEERIYQQFEWGDWISQKKDWVGARSIIRVDIMRDFKGKQSHEVAWYISSLPIGVSHAAKATRGHWECENKLHWRLDVIFNEDACLARSGALNMAVLRRFCMNLLATKDQSKRRMKHRVMAAAIDDDYRSRMLMAD